jgi:mannose-6-phosphate isomerase-like protein (cupin superfamily)
MTGFATRVLPSAPDALAPDGSEVRVLLSLAGGGMAHFRLPAGQVARAVVHRTVEEIWFVTSGRGEIWRSLNGRDETVSLAPGVSLTIPVGTRFQFRAAPADALEIIGVTMPPWPGAEEAMPAAGPWTPTL